MEKETLNLLIGGGIGFLASFLITITTFIYQTYDRNQKRKWDLADKHSQRNEAVISKRLQQIEQEAANILEWANTIFLQYPLYARDGISEDKLNELTAGFIKNTNLIPNAILLKDKKLEETVTKFGTSSLDLYNWVVEGNLSKDKRNLQEVSDIYEELRLYYAYVLRCLDDYQVRDVG